MTIRTIGNTVRCVELYKTKNRIRLSAMDRVWRNAQITTIMHITGHANVVIKASRFLLFMEDMKIGKIHENLII